MLRDGLVRGRAITGVFALSPCRFLRRSDQAMVHLRRVVRILIGESLRDDQATVRIDCQMQLALDTARLRAMLCLQPLTCAKNL